MKKLIISILILLYTFFATEVYGKYDIKRYGNPDGLSNSSVNVLYQGGNTLLWAGTWDGLNVYDSRAFRVFMPSAADSLSLGNSVVRELFEDSSGRMWVATDRGIDCYDPSSDSFTRYFSSSMHGRMLAERSFHLLPSPSGQMYAMVNSHGIFKFDGRSFNLERKVTELSATCIFYDRASVLWILTENGELLRDWTPFERKVLCVRYDAKNDDIWIQQPDGVRRLGSDLFLPFSGGRALAMDCDGTSLFLGTMDGVYELDLRSASCSKILDGVSVLSLLCGTQNILWVGTDMQGIWKLSESIYDFGSVTDGFGGSAVRCFTKNADGDLVVGTKGSGIYVFTPGGKLKRRMTVRNGLSDNAVYALQDDTDVTWIGGDGKGVTYYDKRTKSIRALSLPDSLGFSSVYCILPDGRDTLWVGTSGFGLYRLGIERRAGRIAVRSAANYSFDVLGSNIVYSLLADGPSHIIAATRGGGLVRLDKQSGTAQTLPSGSADDMLCVARSSDGTLWAGSGMGLFAFGPGGDVRSYSVADGLPGNTVHGVLQDSENRIWISTNNGLARLEPDKGIAVSYSQNDGLQSNEFSDGAYFSDGTYLYFGGISGFNKFNPSEVAGNVFNPPFLLKSVVIDNRVMNASTILQDDSGRKKLVLPPGTNSVGFVFVPVDYAGTDRCEISYMLEGTTQDWVRVGNSGQFIFSNLRPGNALLRVRHSDSYGNWCDDEYTLPLRVQDWWWRTRLAKTIYLILAVIAVGVVQFQLRERRKYRQRRKQEEEQRRVAEEIHEAKLDFFTNIAHEFSNSLTLIYGPCEELRRSEAVSAAGLKYLNSIESNSGRMQSLIQQLINFRKAETGHLRIRIGRVDLVALINSELDYFRERISSSSLFFRLNCPEEGVIWNADGDSMEKIVFNLLSNAMKYTPDGGTVEVALSPGKDRLEMDFTNYGSGIPAERQASIFDRYAVLDRFERAVAKGRTSNGIGLAMCKSLVELHGGDISIRSDGSTYTTFHICLPQLEAEEGMPVYSGKSLSDEIPDEGVRVAAPDDAAQQHPEAPAFKDRVLVADDDDDVLEFIRAILSSRFDVIAVHNGREALEAMRDWDPKVVISDLYMPEMDGIALLRAMRGSSRLSHIPFILLSGKGNVDTQIDALEKGVDAYLAKPFHPRHLLARIDRLLGRDAEIMEYGRSAKSAVEQYAGREMKKEDKAFIGSVVDYIASHIDSDDLSPDVVAESLMLSRMQFYRKMKAVAGTAPVEFIRNIRLDFAERQLKTTRRTVQEIMYGCGFTNKAYFYREFAKRFGTTPGEYRRNA